MKRTKVTDEQQHFIRTDLASSTAFLRPTMSIHTMKTLIMKMTTMRNGREMVKRRSAAISCGQEKWSLFAGATPRFKSTFPRAELVGRPKASGVRQGTTRTSWDVSDVGLSKE